MIKILVTGGAGFIGSHLCEELVKNKNYEVFSLDNYSSGSEKNHIEGVEYIKGDTREIESKINFVPDMIYHLGEYSRTSASFRDPAKTWELNTHGTFAVLEFVRKKSLKNKIRILYAGSSTKMADGGDGRNQSPYAWTKATNTELVQRYGEWFGLDYVITYFYNVYGGREVEDGEYATFIGILKRKIKNGENLQIVLPGTQMRSFTHVNDIVRGLILAGEKGTGDGYALGPKEMFTIMDVAKLFTRGDMSKIETLPPLPGDRKTVAIDLSKTEEELGWTAQIKLREHIAEFLNSVSQNI